MRAFLTGATGFVGSHVAHRLVQDGVEVHVLVRDVSSLGRLYDIYDKITLHEGDVTDIESLKRAASLALPEHIYHFANAGVYGGVSASPQRLQEVNTIGLMNLLEAFREIPYSACINVGSSSEYGPKNTPMQEDDVCNPVNAYGISKLAATQTALLEAVLFGKPISTFRLFSPFGPHDDASRLVSKALNHFSGGEPPMRFPHKDAMRDYIYIDDVTDLLVLAANTLKAHQGEVFNVGTGVETPVHDVLSLIARTMGSEASLPSYPEEANTLPFGESPRWVADMEKTFTAFPWRPKHSVEQGIQKTIAWFGEQSKRNVV